jgi:hypothetical protein
MLYVNVIVSWPRKSHSFVKYKYHLSTTPMSEAMQSLPSSSTATTISSYKLPFSLPLPIPGGILTPIAPAPLGLD